MKKKNLIKIIAIILVLTFTVPVTSTAVYVKNDDVFSEEFTPENVISEISSDNSYGKSPEDLDIIGEDTSKRSGTEKHFKLEDGSYLLAQYKDAVHYKDDNNEWVEIDNSLVYEDRSFAEDFDGYTNKSNSFDVKFAENSSDELFRVDDKEYSILMKLDERDANASMITIDNPVAVVDTEEDASVNVNNIISEVSYNDIMHGIDIEYVLESQSVKEYIVVNERRDDYVFSFELILDNLYLRENADGSISIMTIANADTPSEEKYVIPVPYMVDAKDKYSYNVAYSVVVGTNGSYTLNVSADEEWINDADTTFPVRIDPTITKKQTTTTIIDTFVSSNYPDENYKNENYLYVGYDNSNTAYGITRTYINWNVPVLQKSSYVVTHANIKLTQAAYNRTYTPTIEAKRVTGNWTESEITWNNQPSFSETDLDYVTVGSLTDAPTVSLDITKAVVDALNTNVNLGIVLKDITENSSVVNGASFISSAVESGKPTIEIYYRSQKGLDPTYSFIPIECGDVGTAYINTYNGDVSYIHNTYTSSSGKTVINHTFNAYMSDIPTSYDNYESFAYFNDDITVGKYWKTSAQEIIVPITESEYYGNYVSETNYNNTIGHAYSYNDPYGNNIFLVYNHELTMFYEEYEYDEITQQQKLIKHYTDEKGLNYDLCEKNDTYILSVIDAVRSEAGGITSVEVTESKTFKIVETAINDVVRNKGYLITYTKSDNNSLTYNYTTDEFPSQLDSIKASKERSGTILNYDDNGYLVNISTSGQTKVSFSYDTTDPDNIMLASITDAEKGTTTFTYDSYGKLLSVNGHDGNVLIFNYDSNNNRLTSVDWKKSTASTDELICTSFVYDSGVTTVHYYGADRIDSAINTNSTDDLFVKFLFDTNGNNVAVYTQNAQQVTHEAVNPNGLKGINHTPINDPSMNYTFYSGDKLISGTNVFDLNTNADSTQNITESNDAYTGDTSYKLTLTNASSRAIDYIEKTMTVGIGNHTVTAYVKCLDETNKTVELNAWDYYGGVVDHSNVKELKLSDGWTQLSINFTTTEVDIVDIRITLDETDGCILIDDVMIDNQAITWPVSLNATVSSGFEIFWQNDIYWECTNSCFSYVSKNADYINGLDEPDECYQPENVLFGDYSLAIEGSISKENSVYHIYYNNYNDIGNGFILSGWGKADSVPTTDPASRGFELFAYYLYKVRLADGTTETRTVSTAIPFNYQNDEWQFVSQKLNMPTVNDGETMIGVYSITIGALYKGNTGTAYFDNIELTPIEN